MCARASTYILANVFLLTFRIRVEFHREIEYPKIFYTEIERGLVKSICSRNSYKYIILLYPARCCARARRIIFTTRVSYNIIVFTPKLRYNI